MHSKIKGKSRSKPHSEKTTSFNGQMIEKIKHPPRKERKLRLKDLFIMSSNKVKKVAKKKKKKQVY
tara:strand:- start:1643 stop:1840 length:198 start_codon:yes stop_codon:yes gene_type:complete